MGLRPPGVGDRFDGGSSMPAAAPSYVLRTEAVQRASPRYRDPSRRGWRAGLWSHHGCSVC